MVDFHFGTIVLDGVEYESLEVEGNEKLDLAVPSLEYEKDGLLMNDTFKIFEHYRSEVIDGVYYDSYAITDHLHAESKIDPYEIDLNTQISALEQMVVDLTYQVTMLELKE